MRWNDGATEQCRHSPDCSFAILNSASIVSELDFSNACLLLDNAVAPLIDCLRYVVRDFVCSLRDHRLTVSDSDRIAPNSGLLVTRARSGPQWL